MPETKPPLWKIALATTPEQIGRCSSVMRELRAHIKKIDFAARVLQQQKEGYQLAYLELDRTVRSVAGFRIFNLLFSGRTLYIDDLVTHDSDRSPQGSGPGRLRAARITTGIGKRQFQREQRWVYRIVATGSQP